MEALINTIISNQEIQIKLLKAIRNYIGIFVLLAIAGFILAAVMN